MTDNLTDEIDEIARLTRELEEERVARDGAYTERNRVVALAARLAVALGLDAYLAQDPSRDDEPAYVVFIALPAGQVSWHIPTDALPWFHFLPRRSSGWDGHTTEEKYRRVLEPGLDRPRDGG